MLFGPESVMENTTDVELSDFDISNVEGNALNINALASSLTMFKIGKHSN